MSNINNVFGDALRQRVAVYVPGTVDAVQEAVSVEVNSALYFI